MARGEDWTAEELDLIVEDYFDMLSREKAGIRFVKTEHSSALMARIDRSRQSIEFKHCNITAVLQEVGEVGILGYKPRVNYQRAILDAIERHLEVRGIAQLTEVPTVAVQPLRVVAPPPLIVPGASSKGAMAELVRRFDPVERDMRNRELGLAGELLVLDHERRMLQEAGRGDLAGRVRHVSVEDGDGVGYDIESFDPDGGAKQIEVKTTRGTATTSFFISRNEKVVSERLRGTYRIHRVHEYGVRPSVFELRPPLEDAVARLVPEIWRAEMR